jgi:matrixin
MLRFWEREGLSSGARRRARSRFRSRPLVEGMEARALLTAVPGVDYVLAGTRWSDPSHITYSIATDGVSWDHGDNILAATFDAKLGSGSWERAIARALATWESVANINIAQVADSPLDFDTPGRSQGDPHFGDIRFGGYAFLNNDTTTLAQSYYPPPNGLTAAGNVEVNTAMNFNLVADYDLYSVMLHETGHALGLAHATDPAEVMYASYQGVRAGLSPGDIAGIQAIYGPRTSDAYQQQGQGLAVSSAIDVTAALGATNQATLSDPALATIGGTEYFSVVAPTFPGATLQVTASAGNVSLLSLRVSLFDAAGTTLDVQGDPTAWGDNVTARTGQVGPGQRYFIAVTGATRDAFSVGA